MDNCMVEEPGKDCQSPAPPAVEASWHELPGCYVAILPGLDIAGMGATEEAAAADLMTQMDPAEVA